ncbi:MAG TPA: thiolase family protein [Candidatus Binatia bacterium]|nr:thiolase family protein [Candidatus Binatia bacterium]
MSLRGAAAIVGLAERPPQRYSGEETLLELASGVAAEAIADSGIARARIDGLIVHPMGGLPGFVPATVAEYLGLQPTFAEIVDLGGATGAGMVWRAAAAIQAGMCTNCLCVTATTRRPRPTRVGEPVQASRAPRSLRIAHDRSPSAEFDYPYGLIGANVGYAMLATRYAHEYGLSAEQRAKVAVDQRTNANANPSAIFYDQALSIDEVLASEMICAPLRMLEIVMPAAGAAALIVTSADQVAAAQQRPAWILGAGESVTHSSFAQAPRLDATGIGIAARAAFRQAGVAPADVGLASLYDCYTIMVLLTLEEAGFCKRGEAGAFVMAHDLTFRGDFPLNTHGGQLSFGQPGMAGGMSHVTEAVRQLQRRAGARQIADLHTAYVHGNGGIIAEQVGLVLGAQR